MTTVAFAEFCANFGDATAGAAAIMGLGGLLYSFSFLAEQIAGEREARRHHDMPVVLIAPRINWAVTGVADGKLNVTDLFLSLGIRNVTNAAVTHLEIELSDAFYQDPSGRTSKIVLTGVDVQLIDYLPGHSGRPDDPDSDGFQERIEWPLGIDRHELLDRLFGSGEPVTSCPSLSVKVKASCQTIRKASFSCYGIATWSPKHCIEARNHKQRKFLQEFAAARAKFEHGDGGLDRFFKKAKENPLVPFLEDEARH